MEHAVGPADEERPRVEEERRCDEALDGDEVAARFGVRRLDPPLDEWRDNVIAGGLDPWLADSTVELYRAVSAGALADVSPVVEEVLGRPARKVFQPGEGGMRDDIA